MRENFERGLNKKLQVAALASALTLSSTAEASGNTIREGTNNTYTSAKVKEGLEMEGSTAITFSENDAMRGALAIQTNLYDTKLNLGIDTTSLVFASLKRKILSISDTTHITGAMGLEASFLHPKRTLKPGIAMLLEQDFGPLTLGVNGGLAYHVGMSSLYPSMSLNMKMKLGESDLAFTGFFDIPLSRLKDEIKEEILNKTSNTTQINQGLLNADAVFGIRSAFTNTINSNLHYQIEALLLGNSRHSLKFGIKAGISWKSEE